MLIKTINIKILFNQGVIDHSGGLLKAATSPTTRSSQQQKAVASFDVSP